ncbi:TPA: sel1 repeat family protein, partial [Escherichia coli]
MDVWWLIIMEIYDRESIKVYMLTKRILFSLMLIVSPCV